MSLREKEKNQSCDSYIDNLQILLNLSIAILVSSIEFLLIHFYFQKDSAYSCELCRHQETVRVFLSLLTL
jgi:hypothetical protein